MPALTISSITVKIAGLHTPATRVWHQCCMDETMCARVYVYLRLKKIVTSCVCTNDPFPCPSVHSPRWSTTGNRHGSVELEAGNRLGLRPAAGTSAVLT